MEKQLEKCIDEIFSTPGVTGVLCSDNQGLCMASKGTAQAKSAGVLTALTKQAIMLEPSSKPPVVQLDAKRFQILIRNMDDVTMAIYKSSQSN